MTWVAPKTFAANSTLTAADLNVYLRDNFLETEAAMASSPGSYFVGTGLNAIAERIPTTDIVTTEETKTGTTFGNLSTVGPSVTVETSTTAVVFIYCGSYVTDNVGPVYMGFAVSGDTTIAATDNTSIIKYATQGQRFGAPILQTGLTPGSNTFTAKYRVGDGLTRTGHWLNRSISVLPL